MQVDEVRRIVAREFEALPRSGQRRYKAALILVSRQSDFSQVRVGEEGLELLRLHRVALAESRRAHYVGEAQSGLARSL